MRLLLAIVFLGLALQVCGQSASSGAVAASSGAVAPSGSGSGTPSSTGTPSITFPQPPAPINLDNLCKGHIINICPSWENPDGFDFDRFRLYVTAQASGIVGVIRTDQFDGRIFNLDPNTLYDVWVQGVDSSNGVWSANSTIVTMNTDPADPKKDPTRDIQGFTCVKSTTIENRVGALCSWSAAADTVRQINFKVRCVSSLREPSLIRKRIYGGAAASALSQFFAINRDVGTCTIKARFYYARRPTARHVFVLNL